VDFLFGEVAITEPRVDYAGNSGNIISALGPFALDEGWVEAVAPQTLVRINNLNTGKTIEVMVPVENGRAAEDGDFTVDGVPGFGPRIDLRFPFPGGAVTKSLFTADGPRSQLEVPGVGVLEATLIDAANPVVFIDGAAFGVDPCTPPAVLNADADLLARLQAVRAAAAVRFQMVQRPEQAWQFSPMIPFLLMLFAPSDYPSISDRSRTLSPADMDLCTRIVSMNLIHKSINVTVSVATTSAALIPGTLVHEFSHGAAQSGQLRIGHPSGVAHTSGSARKRPADEHGEEGWEIEFVSLGRTARRIMQGEVLVQPSKIRWLQDMRATLLAQ
jgi:2-methylaconitate cis-trans-isomerase PrpF